MKMNIRPGIRIALVAICLVVAAGQVYPQWVEDSIQAPGAWVGSLVYNSREDVVYGASEDGFVFAIDCVDNRVIASHEVVWALALAYDSTDNKAWCSYCGAGQDSLAVIDGASHAIIKRIEMPGATTPVWDPVTDRAYVSCQSTNSVAVLDCRTDSLLCYIPVGACPIKMYMNTLRRKLYVENYDEGSVSVIDMATNQVITTVVVGGETDAGYYCRRVDKFYCSSPPGSVTIIDGRSDSVEARIPLPDHGVALSMAGNEQTATVVMGVLTDTANYAYFVSAPEDSVVSVLSVGRDPYGVCLNSATNVACSANGGSNNVSVMAGDGSHIIKTLQVGNYPFVFAQVPRHNRLYVGHLGTSFVYILRDTTAGVEEAPNADVRTRNAATIVRGVLYLPCGSDFPVSMNRGLEASPTLLDATGRRVAVLRVGANDVSRLAPGVYFVREASGVRREASRVRKVVLTE
jgi:YVTN family beta-propeller protein